MYVPHIKNRMIFVYIGSALFFAALAAFGYFAVDTDGHFRRPAPMNQQFTTDMTYYDLPRMTLAVGQGKDETHVRIDITLEVAKKDLPILEGYQPQITDRLNVFFIALHPEQIRRFSTLPWLRGEMLQQVNNLSMPFPVHDLMLRQMIVM